MNEKKIEIKIDLNLTENYLRIETTLNDASVELTDSTGRRITNLNLSPSCNIDLTGLSPDVYLYKVLSNNVLQKQGEIHLTQKGQH